MPRHRFELGSTLHIYKNERIQLRAAASAEASYPDSETYLDYSNLLEAIKSRDVWVLSMPHLELKISIRIESSLHELKGSLDGILKEMKSSLIKSQLWHDLQVSLVSNDDKITKTQEGIYSLRVVFEFRQRSALFPQPKPPRMPYALGACSSAFDPPPGVLRIALHDINIIFSFSSSSNNIPDGMCGIPRCESFEDLSSTLVSQCGHLAAMIGFDDTCCSSIGGSQTTGRSDDDWMSLDSDSPFCSPQAASDSHISALACPQTECEHLSKAAYQPFITLLDSGFRTLFCQTSPRTTSSITKIAEKPGPSLPEFAPSLFTPGYDNTVAQGARFIPMISKGIAAMLDNVPRSNTSIRLKCTEVSSICSQENSDPDGATNFFVNTANKKSVLKTLLWKSMQHRLCTPGAARQLPSLTTHLQSTKSEAQTTTFATNPNNSQSFHAAYMSDTEWRFAEDSDNNDTLLTDECNSNYGGQDTSFTSSCRTQRSCPISFISANYDHEHALFDNIPNTTDKPSPPFTTAIFDEDLAMLEENEQEDNLATDSPYILPLQPPTLDLSSQSRTATVTAMTLISTSASLPSSDMEILDPSSPVTISDELMLSPALPAFDAIITDSNSPNLFDTKLTRLPNSNGNSRGGGIGDVEMLLL
ncbi:hypothetical protein AJ78_06154 [Emergomyces pasteurianus Ep9510]|uniref:Uncharacterized protein n=1 Tax=Emergomyces pasteurianus Ep9510 TaxID=1447872 RepID=A0A1J9QB57_9EURO|nr:hypothetical protein AJ78_06154 [Emergomyces pasteurianus Ep9510]